MALGTEAGNELCVWVTDMSKDGILVNGDNIPAKVRQKLDPDAYITLRVPASRTDLGCRILAFHSEPSANELSATPRERYTKRTESRYPMFDREKGSCSLIPVL